MQQTIDLRDFSAKSWLSDLNMCSRTTNAQRQSAVQARPLFNTGPLGLGVGLSSLIGPTDGAR